MKLCSEFTALVHVHHGITGHGTQIRRHHYGEFLSAGRQKFTVAVPSNFVVVHLCVYQVTLVHSTHQLSLEDRYL